MTPASRILIATQYFSPKNEIAAVRMTNYAMGLVELGWEVDVATVAANPANPLERRMDLGIAGPTLDAVRVHTAPVPPIATALYRARDAARQPRAASLSTPAPAGAAAGRAPWVRRAAARTAAETQRAAAAVMDGAYARALAAAPGLRDRYDVIWASYGPGYVIDAGARLARRYPDAAYVADVRDLVVRRGAGSDARTRRRQELQEHRFLRDAQAATAVSDGLLLRPWTCRGEVHVLTNGFDLGEAPAPPAGAPRDGTVRLYYGGRIYPERRFDALAVACRELSGRRPVEVHYAGGDERAFRAVFAQHGADHLVRSHGLVSRDESMRLAAEATCDLVFSWNGTERGILTGKVFELISLDRPIVTIVAGQHRGSALEDLFSGDPYRRVFGNDTDPESVAQIVTFIERMAVSGAVVPAEFAGRVRYDGYTYPRLTERLDAILRAAVERRRARPLG